MQDRTNKSLLALGHERPATSFPGNVCFYPYMKIFIKYMQCVYKIKCVYSVKNFKLDRLLQITYFKPIPCPPTNIALMRKVRPKGLIGNKMSCY